MKYDYLVIGGGSGGVRFARLMGAKGYKVGLIEEYNMGGTCVLRGCIPKKLFVYAAGFGRDAKYARDYGWNIDSEVGNATNFSLEHFMEKKDAELQRLSSIYSTILTNNKVDIIRGTASFSGENKVTVTNGLNPAFDDDDVELSDREAMLGINSSTEYTAKNIIVAVGSRSRNLELEGGDLALDSEQFLNLNYLPKTALVLGGGFIALEFTNILLGLGIKVNIFTRTRTILNGFDNDIATHMQEELSKQGVNFVNATQVMKITRSVGQNFETVFNTGESLTTNLVIRALGREPNINRLNLEAAGIETNWGAIKVDDYFQTTNPKVYAIGDVIDRLNLTPVATKQAMYLASNINADKKKWKKFNYENIPSAVFSYPEIATCGLTEQQAVDKGYKVEIYKSAFRPLKSTLTKMTTKSFFKIIVDSTSQKVLGIHICDAYAAEIMQGFGVALKLGVTKAQLNEVIGIHPTSAEELVTMYTKFNG